MIPQLPLPNSRDAGHAAVRVPPPIRFRGIVGTPIITRIRQSPYANPIGYTDAQKAGLRYETRALAHLFTQFGPDIHIQPHIHFRDESGYRTCLPDAVYVTCGSRSVDRRLFVFEIKVQHCPEAWWQLEHLYKPVLASKFPQHEILSVEVCKTYDCSTPFPTKVRLISDLELYIRNPFREFGVYQWRP